MSVTTNRYLSYPAAAAGISRASSGGAAWSFSAYTEVVPASTITSTFHIYSLTWAWPTPLPAADTTYEFIIRLATGTAGSETVIIDIAANIRADTLAGYVPSGYAEFPELKTIAANTRVAVAIAYNTATTSVTLTGIKIGYQIV